MTSDIRQPLTIRGGQRGIVRLAEALGAAYDLFAVSDRIYGLHEGQLLLINHDRLRILINQKFGTLQLARRDGKWEKFLDDISLSRQDLADIISELLKILPFGPTEMVTRVLSATEKDHVQQRLRTGEPVETIAAAYKVTPAEIRALRSAA
jgi:hypothetical protein